MSPHEKEKFSVGLITKMLKREIINNDADASITINILMRKHILLSLLIE